MNEPLPNGIAPVRPRSRRVALWGALVVLLVVAQSLLVFLTANYERVRAQDQVEAAATAAAADVRQALSRQQQSLQALQWNDPSAGQWRADAASLLHARRELMRVERRDNGMHIVDAVDSPYQGPLFNRISREAIELEAQLACANAQRLAAPAFSRSYFVPLAEGLGLEVMDLCLPLQRAGRADGVVISTLALGRLLEEAVGAEMVRANEISFVEGDGTRLARAGARRGAGVFVAERIIDLPGQALQLRVDSNRGSPSLIPNLAVALVLGLSLALAAVVALLARDVRRRAAAEARLAEALALRKAMEDSLVTGLRARDLDGRITHVNAAFCEMVGFSEQELMAPVTPPYWPPELATEYARRQSVRLGGLPAVPGRSAQEARAGFETIFMRRNGERFPVLIFEAPLVDGQGRHTGWMSSVLDVSAQRRVEELSRQQQERLQATARLATIGEMASLLSHELNQPLAAIASYAAGSLNLLEERANADAESLAMLRQAAQRIAEQAERAGRVIKSVHDFVRCREQAREAVRADVLFEAVLPLVRLQARKSGTRIEVELPDPSPRVVCDRTMVEQVLLNLTRNGIQAMETATEPAQRVLTLRARQTHPRWVSFSVIDRGLGISDEVAARLFTPFFTTRSEGMGLGLSLCRTVIEQHGGALDFVNVGATGAGGGTEFRFTLPADGGERPARNSPSATAAQDSPTETHG
ncbi:ATP-binding protein [uncultured Piscinibacter sp.]|uniref:sensor histidine kinase n=1 Tax=uncultured Piscinibacter sp. TaxID=1131835 RepID=UPI002622A2D2|nr:ATP-binding protein [uncultured Piscinibacter sp.]